MIGKEKVEMIIKRDGSVKTFEEGKIADVIYAASKEAGQECDVEALTQKVVSRLKGGVVEVEDIQDTVVRVLLSSKYKSVATQFIECRHERNKVRELKCDFHKAVKSVLQRTDDALLFENGNLDSKALTTQRTMVTGEMAKYYADDILPKDVVEAHHNGEVHYHDKNFNPMQPYTNCCLISLKSMLELGFSLGGAQIETPKSIGVACAVTAQIIAQVSSAQYGGASCANMDIVLEPYVTMSYDKHLAVAEKYDIPDPEAFAKDITIKDVKDACQGLEYEINSLFNSHAQSPFTTTSFGTGTSWMSREIQKAMLEVRLQGLGKEGITAIFPKLILFIEEGVNLKPEDPNYDIKQLAMKCAARRQYPDIISVKNNKDITGSSVPVTSMG